MSPVRRSDLLQLAVVCLACSLPPDLASADPALTILHSFSGASDGSAPVARLIFDGSGMLYGTTSQGGGSDLHCLPDCGTVFKLTPPTSAGGARAETVLHSFSGIDGAAPQAGLIFDKSGSLYGTSTIGGDNNFGTVFRLTPPAIEGGTWAESVLHSFSGSDGTSPRASLIFDNAGALYGTTSGRGPYGTVFKLSPPNASGGAWTHSVLHRFSGADGANPQAPLIFDRSGALYGTTSNGGITAPNCVGGCGTVFRLTPPIKEGSAWTESVLHSFVRSDGALPTGGLIFDRCGALYGTTRFGGAHNQGGVFKLQPARRGRDWTESVLYSFSGNAFHDDGAQPESDLILDEAGALYGTTEFGGGKSSSCNYPEGCGTVFKLIPPTTKGGAWTESVLHSFKRNDGAFPIAGPIFGKPQDENDGRRALRFRPALYGMTFTGGAQSQSCAPNGPNLCGTVFKLVLPSQEDGNR